MITIGIDQGASGGIAYMLNGRMNCFNMPGTIEDILEQLKRIHALGQCRAFIEKVGYHRAGNNASASCKFARHCGHIEAILLALEIPTYVVNPKTWQKTLGTLPKDKGDRKREIKAIMQQRYPHLKVTLLTADAVAICEWGINKGDKKC